MPYVSKAGVVQQRTHLGGERFRLVREEDFRPVPDVDALRREADWADTASRRASSKASSSVVTGLRRRVRRKNTHQVEGSSPERIGILYGFQQSSDGRCWRGGSSPSRRRGGPRPAHRRAAAGQRVARLPPRRNGAASTSYEVREQPTGQV